MYISDHHRDLKVQNQNFDVTVLYKYDEGRVEASSANDRATVLDECNLDNLIDQQQERK